MSAILVRNRLHEKHAGGHSEWLWQSSSSQKWADIGPAAGSVPYYSSIQLLCNGAFPPHALDCAGRHSTPPYNSMYAFAIQEEWGYLCNLNEQEIPSHATSSDKDASKDRGKSVRRDKQRAMVCGHHLLNPFWRLSCCCLSSAHCHFLLQQSRCKRKWQR